MAALLCTGALLRCSFGATPSAFSALPLPGTPLMLGSLPAAPITAIAPGVNIPPFGVCTSLANPQVSAATSAAMGVLTPMPCVPVPAGPWTPPSTMNTTSGQPFATVSSKCLCAWGGVIGVDVPAGGMNSTD